MRIRVKETEAGGDNIGWCVSGVAYRFDKNGDLHIWNRPFTCGYDMSEEEAENYVLEELCAMWDADLGWKHIATAMPIRITEEI